ncbi:MAG: hypothetical protein QOD36_3648 [Mycobacterium sp.]|nr:hypothetical protein [Mycobacterium sp.]
MACFSSRAASALPAPNPTATRSASHPTTPRNGITGRNKVKRNASGAAQLRLDAIDALQTHYGTPRIHQPVALALAVADELLDWIGFSNVVRAQDETVTACTPETVAGSS